MPLGLSECPNDLGRRRLGLENMVDVTVFLTNMKADFTAFNCLYAKYFGDVQPCRTTVEVNSLPTPIAIELKVIATAG